MSTRILLQTILRLQDQIKTGAANFMDVSAEYFKSTGNFLDDSQKSVALEEINKIAPDNITPLKGGGEGIMSEYKSVGDDLTDVEKESQLNTFLEGSDRVYTQFVNKALVDLQNASKSEQQQMIKAIIGRKGMFKYLDDADAKKLLNSVDNPGAGTGEVVGLRGDETFDELIDSTSLKDNLMQTDNPFSNLVKTTEKGPKTLDQRRADAIKELGLDKGVGSLYPKGKPGEIFDEANSKRDEMAGFMKAMRDAGIKNQDVMNTAKITDVAEGKRAATTLARAADMNADTAIKQELLGTLDEDIATNGPKFFQEEYMGFDSMGNLLENITTTVNNGIYDDLIAQGVPEDKVSSIFRYIASVRDNMKYDPKAVLRKIADDVEMEDIKYDTTFWDNYIDEILKRIQKPAPRFADGGLV